MATALGRESFFWHKLHSLTGIIPVGFYTVQHLTLNSFSLGGAEKYDSISNFFYALPEHLLMGMEVLMVWIPLAFHMIYGLFITRRAENNYFTSRYKWSQNRMYAFQRITGVFLMAFLIFHFCTTTLQVKLNGNNPEVVNYYAMQAQFTSNGYLVLAFYVLGVLAASYHLCYGIWNFSIRWGITVSDAAQIRVQKISLGLFILVTIMGWAALAGFLMPAKRHAPVQVNSAIVHPRVASQQ